MGVDDPAVLFSVPDFFKTQCAGFSASLRLRWRVFPRDFPRVSSVRLHFVSMLRLRFITASEPAGLLLRFYFNPPATPFSIRFTVDGSPLFSPDSFTWMTAGFPLMRLVFHHVTVRPPVLRCNSPVIALLSGADSSVRPLFNAGGIGIADIATGSFAPSIHGQIHPRSERGFCPGHLYHVPCGSGCRCTAPSGAV